MVDNNNILGVKLNKTFHSHHQSRNIFKLHPEIKGKLWRGEFWSDGYWVVTVSQHGTEKSIKEYVKNQGKDKYNSHYNREELSDF